MTREQLLGTALVLGGCAAFGLALSRRSREARARRRRHRDALQPVKAVASPGGEWLVVARAGPPFEDRVDSAIERLLWFLFWLVPVGL